MALAAAESALGKRAHCTTAFPASSARARQRTFENGFRLCHQGLAEAVSTSRAPFSWWGSDPRSRLPHSLSPNHAQIRLRDSQLAEAVRHEPRIVGLAARGLSPTSPAHPLSPHHVKTHAKPKHPMLADPPYVLQGRRNGLHVHEVPRHEARLRHSRVGEHENHR